MILLWLCLISFCHKFMTKSKSIYYIIIYYIFKGTTLEILFLNSYVTGTWDHSDARCSINKQIKQIHANIFLGVGGGIKINNKKSRHKIVDRCWTPFICIYSFAIPITMIFTVEIHFPLAVNSCSSLELANKKMNKVVSWGYHL